MWGDAISQLGKRAWQGPQFGLGGALPEGAAPATCFSFLEGVQRRPIVKTLRGLGRPISALFCQQQSQRGTEAQAMCPLKNPGIMVPCKQGV